MKQEKEPLGRFPARINSSIPTTIDLPRVQTKLSRFDFMMYPKTALIFVLF